MDAYQSLAVSLFSSSQVEFVYTLIALIGAVDGEMEIRLQQLYTLTRVIGVVDE